MSNLLNADSRIVKIEYAQDAPYGHPVIPLGAILFAWGTDDIVGFVIPGIGRSPLGRLEKNKSTSARIYPNEEREAWKALGAWWNSSTQALAECGPNYRPTIRDDASTKPSLKLAENVAPLIARTCYDLVARYNGDSRRAWPESPAALGELKGKEVLKRESWFS